MVWGNALLVLDLALHIVDGVGRLDLKGDGLARQGLNEAVAMYALVAVPLFAHVCSCRGRSVRFAGAVFGFEISWARIRTSALLNCQYFIPAITLVRFIASCTHSLLRLSIGGRRNQ